MSLPAPAYRAILFHKQATSARLRFLVFANGSVCAFEPLPTLSQIHTGEPERLTIHPAAVVKELQTAFGFEADVLRAEEGFPYRVEAPRQIIRVLLIAIGSIDPPFALAQRIGARFVDLPEARGLPAVELELLRGAYELLIGG